MQPDDLGSGSGGGIVEIAPLVEAAPPKRASSLVARSAYSETRCQASADNRIATWWTNTNSRIIITSGLFRDHFQLLGAGIPKVSKTNEHFNKFTFSCNLG